MSKIMKLFLVKAARFAFLMYLLASLMWTLVLYDEGYPATIMLLWTPAVVIVGFSYWKYIFRSFLGVAATLWAVGIIEMLFVGEFYLPVAWRLIVVVAVVKVVYDFISELIKAKKRFDSKFDSIRASSKGNNNDEGDKFEPSWYDDEGDEGLVYGDVTAKTTSHDFSGLNGFKYF